VWPFAISAWCISGWVEEVLLSRGHTLIALLGSTAHGALDSLRGLVDGVPRNGMLVT